MKSDEFPREMLGVPMLAKLWNEDDVWNVSALDMPVVAYGKTIDEARQNFEEALLCHFQALQHFHELEDVANTLRAKAAQYDFYRERLRAGTIIENFSPANLGPSPDHYYV